MEELEKIQTEERPPETRPATEAHDFSEEPYEEPKGKKQTKKQLFWEIFRFLIVGGIATLVDYAVYYLFRKWILPPSLLADSGAWNTVSLVISTALGFCVGLVVNWILSVKFVFRDVKDEKEARSKKSFAIFALIGVIGLGITELGMHLGVSFLPEITLFARTAFLGLAWKEWVMKVVMTCLVLVWNYVGRKLFIFK